MDPHFDGVIFQTYASELQRRMQYPFPPFVILDTRESSEYDSGHIEGALSVPGGSLGGFLPGAEEAEYVVVGAGPGDLTVRAASLELKTAGARRIVELAGGMVGWVRSGLDVSGRAAA